ncbi:MAG: hypothetical protein AAF366_09630 [Pseudomonadota bacterium]
MSRLTRHPPITLHLGAHRTASSTLQRLLERNADRLAAQGVAVWTPQRTRSGLLTGVMGDPGRVGGRRDEQAQRAAGRVSMLRADMTNAGIDRLVVSDENMLGGLRENILLGRLYPSVSARMHRLIQALPGVNRICLSVRSPDTWWASAFAFLMTRGFAPPDGATIEAVLRARRGWRHVIEDIAAACPDAALDVWSFEERGKDPAGVYELLTGQVPSRSGVPVLNAAPTLAALRARLADEGWIGTLPGLGDSYAPFDPDARAGLRAAFAEDLAWLRDGADGIARYHGAGTTAMPRLGKGPRHERFRRSAQQMGTAG